MYLSLMVKKPLALKATPNVKMDSDYDDDSNNSSDDEKDEEIAFLTRQFRKFLQKKNKGKFRPFLKKNFPKKTDNNKKFDLSKKANMIICYECKR